MISNCIAFMLGPQNYRKETESEIMNLICRLPTILHNHRLLYMHFRLSSGIVLRSSVSSFVRILCLLILFCEPIFSFSGIHHLFPNTTMNGYYDPQQHQSTNIEIPQGPTNQPRLLLRNLNESDATFHLSGVELAYANSLRRVMMADVPTIGAFA